MVCEVFCENDSVVHRLDPRGRVVAAALFSALVAVSSNMLVAGAGLALAVIACLAAELPLRPVLRRLAGINAFVVMVGILLPLTTSGPPLLAVGPFGFSREGLLQAAHIGLKCNAIVLALTALLSTIEVAALGHALSRLHVPQKLVHLFLFTIRYVDVLRHERQRLQRAMKVRAFRPRTNVHTFRSIGYLVGMLLVRSFERSERVVAAMKCRGFCGRFYVLTNFRAGPADALFGVLAAAALLVLAFVEWL